MNFVAYGNKNQRPLMLIHGLASTADLCFQPLLPYLRDEYVILCELPGHCAACPREMTSLKRTIDDIEQYIVEKMNGYVYALCGFSMGATIAVELIARGRIKVERVLLDAPITIEMGWKARPFTRAFMVGTSRIKRGKPIPKFLLDRIMGKGNNSVIEMMYADITDQTIQNACRYLYHYQIPERLREFSKPVLLWRGSEEPIPTKSEAKLKEYLPQMVCEVFEGLGHGQFLHEHPKEYAEKLKRFLR